MTKMNNSKIIQRIKNLTTLFPSEHHFRPEHHFREFSMLPVDSIFNTS